MTTQCQVTKLAASTAYNKRGCRCDVCIDQKRDAVLRQRYGITADEYHALWVGQGRRCGCCGKRLQRPHVDHDHETGAVRGLLCQNCNLGIGKLGDNIQGVLDAAQYLAGER